MLETFLWDPSEGSGRTEPCHVLKGARVYAGVRRWLKADLLLAVFFLRGLKSENKKMRITTYRGMILTITMS